MRRIKSINEYFNSDGKSSETFKLRIEDEKRKRFILKTIQQTKADDEILTTVYNILQK